MEEKSGGSASNGARGDDGPAVRKPDGPGRVAGSLVPRHPLLAVLALLPWIAALLLLYLLESRAVWQPSQPLRAPAAVTILAVGMVLSFLAYNRLRRRG